MLVTVAICTWNRCELLRQTLAHFTQLIVPDEVRWELLIVDNNCTDATLSVIESFAGQLPIRVVHESVPGLSPARNRALHEAQGELVLWTDDDVLVDGRWLVECVSAARQYPEATAFGGTIEPWFPDVPDPDLQAAFPALARGFCGLDHDLPPGPLPGGFFVWGANMAYRRKFIAGMTFDVNLGPSPTSAICGDEVDFLQRIRSQQGTLIWWPAMRVKHFVAPSRTTVAYMKTFSFGKGLEHVAAFPSLGGVSFVDAPRWLWREWARATVFHIISCCGKVISPTFTLRSGPPAADDSSPRTHRLVWLRERQFLAGMLAGYRQRSSLGHGPNRATGTAVGN